MRSNQIKSRCQSRERRSDWAKAGFTLIELLVVIAIIGSLAALIAGLAAPASDKRRRSVVAAQKEWLLNAIEGYKVKMGSYPPDNPSNVLCNAQLYTDESKNPYPTNADAYFDCTATNTLLYELTGAQIINPSANPILFKVFDSTVLTNLDLKALARIGGIVNSAPVNSTEQRSIAFLNPAPKASQIKYYYPLVSSSGKDMTVGSTELLMPTNLARGLVVPVSLETLPHVDQKRHDHATYVNFWHYDCSSPNRHNRDSFDLWAVFTVGRGQTITNGNWIQQ